MWYMGIWCWGDCGGAGFTVGLDEFECLFQP